MDTTPISEEDSISEQELAAPEEGARQPAMSLHDLLREITEEQRGLREGTLESLYVSAGLGNSMECRHLVTHFSDDAACLELTLDFERLLEECPDRKALAFVDCGHSRPELPHKLVQRLYLILAEGGVFLYRGAGREALLAMARDGGFSVTEHLVAAGEENLTVIVGRRHTRNVPYFARYALRAPVAMVFNNFFRTAGGGERSALDIAAALRQLGYRIMLAADHPMGKTLEEIAAPFGVETDRGWSLQEFPGIGALLHYVQESRLSVFVNHTYGSFVRNYAPVGLYCVMFPFPTSPENIANMATYHRLFCNSHFTEGYVRQYWGESLPAMTLLPPISRVHLDKQPVAFSEKEKVVLCVGRFNVFGHNKNQLEVVRAFVEAKKRGIFDDEWKLVVIGTKNEGKETEEYVQKCREESEGYPVEILTNADIGTLTGWYRKASFLFQFTGLGLEFGVRPEHCEHLGLVTLDCFAYGVVPVVYSRGGAALLLRHGRNGFTFYSIEELLGICRIMADQWGESLHRWMFENSLECGMQYGFQEFKDRLERELAIVLEGSVQA